MRGLEGQNDKGNVRGKEQHREEGKRQKVVKGRAKTVRGRHEGRREGKLRELIGLRRAVRGKQRECGRGRGERGRCGEGEEGDRERGGEKEIPKLE